MTQGTEQNEQIQRGYLQSNNQNLYPATKIDCERYTGIYIYKH